MKAIQIVLIIVFACFFERVLAFPMALTQRATLDGETITMQLTRVNIRGENFEVLTRDGAGSYSSINPIGERSYIGTVDEYPGAVSCGILRDDGTFWGKVYFDRGLTWVTQDSVVDKPLPPLTKTPESFCIPFTKLQGGYVGKNTFGYDIGVEVSYSFFKGRAENNLAKTLEMIEFSTVTTAAIYIRDLLLRPYLGRIIIYTNPNKDKFYNTYTGTSIVSQYLNKVVLDWESNHSDSQWDMVLAISDVLKLPNSPMVDAFGGLAIQKATACCSSKNGSYGEFWRHEMAHSWGLGHYDGSTIPGQGPEGVTINSGNGYSRFSAPEVERIIKRRNSGLFSILNEGVFAEIKLPPYAALDNSEFRRGVDTKCIIDVLANDHDANSETFTISKFDKISENGGDVTPIGNQLSYIAPDNFTGMDLFRYTIKDESGQTAEGVVLINVYDYSFNRLHLPLDENSGTIAYDKSIYKNDGSVGGTNFSNSSVTGVIGRGINFNGTNQYIDVKGIILNPDSVTFTAWIKPNSSQEENLAGIIFNIKPTRTGFNINKDNELAYIWNGSGDRDAWHSGLIVPSNTWTFIALVVEPTKATIYMNSGSGFQSAVNISKHERAAFSTLSIGGYPGWDRRFFGGAIDDVQIYGKVLSLAELQNVAKGDVIDFDGKTDNSNKKALNSNIANQFIYKIHNNIFTYQNFGGKSYLKLLSPKGRVIFSKDILGGQSGVIDFYEYNISNGFYLLSIESQKQSIRKGILKIN